MKTPWKTLGNSSRNDGRYIFAMLHIAIQLEWSLSCDVVVTTLVCRSLHSSEVNVRSEHFANDNWQHFHSEH